MKPNKGAFVGLLLLATCGEDAADHTPSVVGTSARALGTVPPTEVAVWRKVAPVLPDDRYLQAVAFDEKRRVLVMFGGMTPDPGAGSYVPSRETWEWSPQAGRWTNRTGTGVAPEARSGAGMVFDSARDKLVLFGGRAAGGLDFEDTWEWDPVSATWTDVTTGGGHPSARSRQGMVYEQGNGKILLFGGGRSDAGSPDGNGISASLGESWEYTPATSTWKQLTTTVAPSARHDLGLVWDSARSKAVLFGGMQADASGVAGTPKQDTWEWDPTDATWSERTATGNKPSPRSAHAMAFDGKRGKVLLFGGLDVTTGGSLNDLWELTPTTFAWSRRLTGAEYGMPAPRRYASLVSDDGRGLLDLVAGATDSPQDGGDPYGSDGSGPQLEPAGTGDGPSGTHEVWELDPVKPAFIDRTAPSGLPAPRVAQAMAFSPATGKTYLFGGYDALTGELLDDLWEWDGESWARVEVGARPAARYSAGLAYDPARMSLILYGGIDVESGWLSDETWELTTDNRWTRLEPANSPEPLMGQGMVADTTRGKILLFGGMGEGGWSNTGVYTAPLRDEVWEWDGVAMTWTNRTPPAFISSPSARTEPQLTYDEGRQRMFLFDGMEVGSAHTAFWEWNPITTAWVRRDTGDGATGSYYMYVAYDSMRRRQVVLTDSTKSSPEGQATWDIDTTGPTLYVRTTAATPGGWYGASMVFDSKRDVVVLYGGQAPISYMAISDTWEYQVSNLADGEGCSPTLASSCASGFCVDGACCDVAACTGPCKSCNVSGSEGTCAPAKPGTEVPGSCTEGRSCDEAGACKTKNGQPCTAATDCASGFCADGVCCEEACAGTCAACNQTGRAGRCTPYPLGTDPQNECGQGNGVCKSTCDGVGDCVFPNANVYCGDCVLCNGSGDCSFPDYGCGGAGIGRGGAGGTAGSLGGSGGRVPNVGGDAGTSSPTSGGMGGGARTSIGAGGSGGTSLPAGMLDGGLSGLGGIGGGASGSGGLSGSAPQTGGTRGTVADGGAGSSPQAGASGGSRDAAQADAGKAKARKSGCTCALGAGLRPATGMPTLLLLGGGVLFGLCRRRRLGEDLERREI